MLICLASSRSRSWIRVSKSFRLSRQLNGASKSMKSSTYRPPPSPEDHTFFFSSSSSSPLPETTTGTSQTGTRMTAGINTKGKVSDLFTCITLTYSHLIVICLLSRHKVLSTDTPVSSVPINWWWTLEPAQTASTPK